MKGDGDGRDVHPVDRGRQVLDGSGARLRRHVGAGGKTMRELAVQLVGEDRADDGDADRTADRPEEGRARGRDAEPRVAAAFCTASTSTCITSPMPRPRRNM